MSKKKMIVVGILIVVLMLVCYLGLLYFLWDIPHSRQRKFLGAIEEIREKVDRINVGGQLSNGHCLSYQTITDDSLVDEVMEIMAKSDTEKDISVEIVTTSSAANPGTDETELTPQTYRMELYDKHDREIAEITYPTASNNKNARCKIELSEPFRGEDEFDFAVSDYDKLVDLTIKY